MLPLPFVSSSTIKRGFLNVSKNPPFMFVLSLQQVLFVKWCSAYCVFTLISPIGVVKQPILSFTLSKSPLNSLRFLKFACGSSFIMSLFMAFCMTWASSLLKIQLFNFFASFVGLIKVCGGISPIILANKGKLCSCRA